MHLDTYEPIWLKLGTMADTSERYSSTLDTERNKKNKTTLTLPYIIIIITSIMNTDAKSEKPLRVHTLAILPLEEHRPLTAICQCTTLWAVFSSTFSGDRFSAFLPWCLSAMCSWTSFSCLVDSRSEPAW